MRIFILVLTLLLGCASDAEQTGSAAETPEEPDELLQYVNEEWTGDLDGMIERGFLRILTVHNPLFFTFDGVEQRGLVVAMAKAFEDHLGEEVGRVRSPTVVLIPVARDELLPDLAAGRGDIAIANLTITPDRQEFVAFGTPMYPDVRELVVTGPAATDVSSFDDLARSEVHVRRSSSYFEHLEALNARRREDRSRPVPVRTVDEYLEDYDLLDLVNSGILPAVIVDSHKAALWEQVFPEIEVHEDLVVHAGSQIAWAVRKDAPELLASVNAFAATARKGTLLGNMMLRRYLGETDWIENVLSDESRRRYESTIEIIRRYADEYDFDWLMIAAQAYQESRFDQAKRSPAGAVGIMQLLPTTAADPAVGIPDISTIENNVHAGVRYLHWLREQYFSDESIAPLDQVLFSFAAYNAGPGAVARARRRARQLGFDPDRWFGHVEIGMYRAVSGEPAAYVRNIYKYYIAYRRLEETGAARREAREAVE
jgi:membrane-bound lytic murein transglycosylase MltF